MDTALIKTLCTIRSTIKTTMHFQVRISSQVPNIELTLKHHIQTY